MIENDHIFHLAIPSHDLERAESFYIDGLNAETGRKYDDRLTMDFYGDQIVCHKTSEEEIDDDVTMYPRHFGVTVTDESDFEAILDNARTHDLPFFQEPMIRFEGETDEHRTFFLQDPSNNLLEFKWYNDPSQMY
ncbi:VOC family protein [Halalkalicoccus tibetensis]|uniref:VOC family protein n=1 Tax=Halalkalicoccus tibetensis TaxID=175632 RepID=A0ABD5V0A6_9EURY